MWHVCMESGINQASIRNGLIGSCLYYACIHNSVPVDRQKVIEKIDGNSKGFLKGEKIFMQIMNDNKTYNYLCNNIIDIKENDAFVKYCNQLSVPFKAVNICNEIYVKNLEILDCVTPQSSIAGILYYVVKTILKEKKPSKTIVSNALGVCIPTINKVYKILEANSA